MNSTKALFAMFLLSLFAIPAGAQEEHKFSFQTIQGNRIAWSCEGTGSPTIVLIAGMGLSAHDSFRRTYHSYDGPGRICMYDRAGMGESTFQQPKTRTLAELVDELHQLSSQQRWGNLMLVPHSFAGWIARGYADKYPDEVSGILLLDTAHEDWLPHLKLKMTPADWAIMERIVAWHLDKFHEDYFEAQEAVRKTRLRQTLPITVLSRGVIQSQLRLERMSYGGIDLFESEHRALQDELAKLTANSEHRVARYASHIVDSYDPWLVIDEIKLLHHRITDGHEGTK